jgi:hypothetical protein
MIVNLANVSVESPAEWIKPVRLPDGSFAVNKYILKVVSVDDSEYNSAGERVLKVDFKTSDEKRYQESFPLSGKFLWKLKQLAVALRAPDEFDTVDLVGRYVIATIGGREYNGKDYNNLISWEYSKLNDNLPAFSTFSVKSFSVVGGDDFNIDDSEIPF